MALFAKCCLAALLMVLVICEVSARKHRGKRSAPFLRRTRDSPPEIPYIYDPSDESIDESWDGNDGKGDTFGDLLREEIIDPDYAYEEEPLPLPELPPRRLLRGKRSAAPFRRVGRDSPPEYPFVTSEDQVDGAAVSHKDQKESGEAVLESVHDPFHAIEEIIDPDYAEEATPVLTKTETLAKLIEDVFQNSVYRAVNPVANGESLRLSLSYLCARFDEKEHVLTSRVWESLRWVDPRLQWNPNDYDGITEIRIPAWNLWTPDLQVYNSIENNAVRREWVNAVVDFSGGVFYAPPSTYTTICRPGKAPKSQDCKIIFGSWTYDQTLLPLEIEGEGFFTDYYDRDCPYTVSKSEASLGSQIYGEDEVYQFLNVTFTIKPNDYDSRVRH